jgi:4-hydroxy-2-oxoheptanedioate aldolase
LPPWWSRPTGIDRDHGPSPARNVPTDRPERRAGCLSCRGASLAEADGLVLVVVQVESPRGVEAAGEIAGVEGVDVLFVGPADLSHALGCFGRFDDPAFVAAVRSVADACRAAGKAPGVLASSPEDAERYLAEGYRFVGVSGDGGFLARAASAAAAALRARAGRQG